MDLYHQNVQEVTLNASSVREDKTAKSVSFIVLLNRCSNDQTLNMIVYSRFFKLRLGIVYTFFSQVGLNSRLRTPVWRKISSVCGPNVIG